MSMSMPLFEHGLRDNAFVLERNAMGVEFDFSPARICPDCSSKGPLTFTELAIWLSDADFNSTFNLLDVAKEG